MKKVYILPTGDEIKNGTVLDLDAPAIMAQTVAAYPCAEVTRMCPVVDVESAILEAMESAGQSNPDLVVLIGGSGGGHRFSPTLGKDFTHSALQQYLEQYASREIYGKNGHMWTKLFCGQKGETVFINLPGPYAEATAAYAAFLASEGAPIEQRCLSMAEAVFAQYPTGAAQPL